MSNARQPSHLQLEQWRDIIQEASELGVFGFVLAGGEPFLMPGLLDLCKQFKNNFFIIISNGTAISDRNFKELSKLANVAVIVSIEGSQQMTDQRRGEGVYERVMDCINKFNKLGVINGISVTITRNNFRFWMNPANIDKLIKSGVRIGAFLEYIPTNPFEGGDHGLMLTDDERALFRARILEYRAAKPIYVAHSPGDEPVPGIEPGHA
jgi:MoaA/NifB/PqqE/SkfB family radical SAM enzyme